MNIVLFLNLLKNTVGAEQIAETIVVTAESIQNAGLRQTFSEVLDAALKRFTSEKAWLPALNFSNFSKHFNSYFEILFRLSGSEYSQMGMAALISQFCCSKSNKTMSVDFKHAVRRFAAHLKMCTGSDCVRKLTGNKTAIDFYGTDAHFLMSLEGVLNWLTFVFEHSFDIYNTPLLSGNILAKNFRIFIESMARTCLWDSSLLLNFSLHVRAFIDLSRLNINTPFVCLTPGKYLSICYLSISSDKTRQVFAKEIDFSKLRRYPKSVNLAPFKIDMSINFTENYEDNDVAKIGQKNGRNYIVEVKNNENLASVWVFRNVYFDKFKFSLQQVNKKPVLFFCDANIVYRLDLDSGHLETIYQVAQGLKFCQFETNKIVLFNPATSKYLFEKNIGGSHTSYARPDKFYPKQAHHLFDFLRFSGGRDIFRNEMLLNFHQVDRRYFYLPNLTHFLYDSNTKLFYFLNNKIALVI